MRWRFPTFVAVHDVVVVGAGPAGAMAGLTAAKLGLRCVVVDKANFPRVKPCGGALTPRIVDAWPWVEPLATVRSTKGFIYGPKEGDVLGNETTDRALAYFCRRVEFDAGLVEHAKDAGVEFREGEHVKGVEERDDRVIVKLSGGGGSLSGRFCFAADGVNSVVRGSTPLRQHWRQEDRALVFVSEVEVGSEAVESLYTDRFVSHMHFRFGGTNGYGWIFPKREHVNVGFGALDPKAPASALRRHFFEYVAFCQKAGLLPEVSPGKGGERQAGSSLDSPSPWFLPMRGPPEKFATARTFCLGDAAGFVHPMTGEGILYAMWSGQLAAEAVAGRSVELVDGSAEAAAEGEGTPSTRYAEACETAFAKELRQLAGMQRWVGRAIGLVIRIGRRDPDLVDMLDQLLTGVVPLSELKWKVARRVIGGVLRGRWRAKKE
ncbi:MAG: geranylgeranyl reductase family protein [Promethearchaeota archaeon]